MTTVAQLCLWIYTGVYTSKVDFMANSISVKLWKMLSVSTRLSKGVSLSMVLNWSLWIFICTRILLKNISKNRWLENLHSQNKWDICEFHDVNQEFITWPFWLWPPLSLRHWADWVITWAKHMIGWEDLEKLNDPPAPAGLHAAMLGQKAHGPDPTGWTHGLGGMVGWWDTPQEWATIADF